jgi:phosphatidylethanolamine-binding protein (PEBP) family uncharacterized protein
MLCDDPDAPAGTWHRWAAYDLPPILMLALSDNSAVISNLPRFQMRP